MPEPDESYVRDVMIRRVLRAAKHLDRFTASDLCVALDAGTFDAHQVRNRLCQLSRAGDVRVVVPRAQAKTEAWYELTEIGRRRAS